MVVGPLVSEVCFTFVLAAVLLHRYGNFSQHPLLVTVSVFVAWYFSFTIIFILPLDVSTAAYRQCLHDASLVPSNGTMSNSTPLHQAACVQPWSFVPEGVLQSLWRVVYWTSQALTWLILPLMQSYSTAGEFTMAGKLRRALIENAIYYGSYLLIFGVLLVYLALQPGMNLDAAKLKVVCVSASNTWGLFLLVLLLGHGLVEVPRGLWHRAQPGHTLCHTYFRAAKLSLERAEAQERLDDLLQEIQQVSSSLSSGHLQRHMDVILAKLPEGTKVSGHSRQRVNAEVDILSGSVVTERTLVRLHQQVIRALQHENRTSCQWRLLVEQALYLEDVARTSEAGRGERRLRSPTLLGSWCGPTVEWYWLCRVRSVCLRALSLLLGVWSVVVVWSEMTFFIRSPMVSLFGLFHRAAERRHDYLAIELMSIVTLGYLCVCAYYTVFRVRVLNYYYLAPHHLTDAYSLVFAGMLLCRLTPPLCLNFLGLLHLDTHVSSEAHRVETAYTEIMGHLDLIPIVARGFNLYFPTLICVLCLATWWHLGSRLLHCLGFEQFITDDELTGDLVNEGRDLIKRERGRRQRAADQRRRPAVPRQPLADHSPPNGGGLGLTRSGSEESARTELLRGVEPLAGYTAPRATEDAWRRPFSSPPRGLFDDV
ncbi:G-protein coupled receptor-associated protein LMBRD2B isoform X1 [Dermacentor andersoni]|uniref:G-protein coupled receptor-associated protein LMBRD2B isoform X1 n=1 Tax=Dermacentor andersoni TaxID=34620 RepID=UPI002155EFAA|nr:G-protein coupled receptor-associated protein LMBRD2B-like isoform X1 [Dermacentor andersoni]XP_054926005.1 G-protein coupled receptor-associated protein LMBRD2B-like isoform X1 [Dermacentor andersoni]